MVKDGDEGTKPGCSRIPVRTTLSHGLKAAMMKQLEYRSDVCCRSILQSARLEDLMALLGRAKQEAIWRSADPPSHDVLLGLLLFAGV